ncbi:MAG: phosphoribosylformimino-5-aminoimidazole carboxamide ribotide isomerase, partial [Thermoproteota archaeon]|nr:phosphoribosylformimino-5-aminoimidazole carboxamide ribotide isomerase [Thermoproteota archaeon]
AIDLMKGMVVRLERGDPKTFKTYQDSISPLDVAEKWKREGARFIHIIDLDAAMNVGSNLGIISELIQQVGIPVQVGGGIRSKKVAQGILKLDARRVIVATMAFEMTSDLINLLKEFGSDRIVVALDYLDDRVMVRGWKSSTEFTLKKAIIKFLDLGVKNYLATSVSRDGLLSGPDYVTLKNVVEDTGADVFAAGGISSLEDLIKLKETGIKGVVIGKALYENKFTLRDAIRIVEN